MCFQARSIVVLALAGFVLANCFPTTTSSNVERDMADLLARLCWDADLPARFDPTTTLIQWPLEVDVHIKGEIE
jgi:hypothetical protein